MKPGDAFAATEPYVAQPEIPFDPSTHVRVLVCDGSPVAAFHRIPDGGSRDSGGVPVNNLDAGGHSTPADPAPVAELAVAAAKAVDGLLVGVDLVPDGAGGYAILEINSAPGLEGANRHAASDVYRLASLAIRRSLS